MLYVFGFERTAVVVGDLYFIDPDPAPGQDGAEHGVRVEVRVLARGTLKGSVYSARPIEVGRAVWRADLLESVAGPPGSFDRAHYHPAMRGWEPGHRVFDRKLSADPIGWLRSQLARLPSLLDAAGVPPMASDAGDAAELRRCLPEVTSVAERLLARVRAGELAGPPVAEPGSSGGRASARVGWL